MTDKHKDEYGFDLDDMENLKKVDDKPSSEDADNNDELEQNPELDADADMQDQESGAPTKDYFEHINKNGRERIKSEIEEADLDEPEKKKTSTGLILGVSGVIVTLLVGVGGYFLAPLVLGNGAGQQQASSSFYNAPEEAQASIGFSNSDAVDVAPAAKDDSFAFSNDTEVGDDFGSDLGDDFDVDSIGEADLFGSQNTLDDSAESGFSVGRNSEVHDGIARQEKDLAHSGEYDIDEKSEDDIVLGAQISDEERMYDNILAEAAAIDAPHTAIKIDRTAVNMELQVKRVDRVEHDIAETRKSLREMSDVIGEIRKQTESISKALRSSSENNKEVSDSVKKLSEKLDEKVELQKSAIDALRAEFNAVKSKQQVAAVAPAKPKPQAEPVRVAAKPVANQNSAVAATAPVSLPAARPKPVAVRAPAPKPQSARVSSTCEVTTVSENWRVKGVTPTSAYVERTQDGQGLLLRAGVSLPGFGTVRSFNEIERSVCTTNGIVRR